MEVNLILDPVQEVPLLLTALAVLNDMAEQDNEPKLRTVELVNKIVKQYAAQSGSDELEAEVFRNLNKHFGEK